MSKFHLENDGRLNWSHELFEWRGLLDADCSCTRWSSTDVWWLGSTLLPGHGDECCWLSSGRSCVASSPVNVWLGWTFEQSSRSTVHTGEVADVETRRWERPTSCPRSRRSDPRTALQPVVRTFYVHLCLYRPSERSERRRYCDACCLSVSSL